jgi:hypothetical protein
MVIFTELLLMEVSVTEVAVIVTWALPGGTVEGAVKVLFAPLAVWPGLNEVAPQNGAGEQLQVTPPFLGSSVTVAATLAVEPTTMLAGAVVIMIARVVELLPPPHAALNMAQSTTRTIRRFPRLTVVHLSPRAL